jgi:hypothetical protein
VSAVSQDIQRYSYIPVPGYLHKLQCFAFDKKDGNFSVHFLVLFFSFITIVSDSDSYSPTPNRDPCFLLNPDPDSCFY